MRLNIGMPALLLALLIEGPAFAQSASQSMNQAGQSAEKAASNAAQAAKQAFHGAATAIDDSAITAKVKTALHDDKLTHDADIHVSTVAGIVTLSGTAPSDQAADRAQQLAQETTGVKGVKNQMTLASTGSTAH